MIHKMSSKLIKMMLISKQSSKMKFTTMKTFTKQQLELLTNKYQDFSIPMQLMESITFFETLNNKSKLIRVLNKKMI